MVEPAGKKRLGGWTRLWVVASIIWVAGCIVVTVLAWPNREDYLVVPADATATVEADAMAAIPSDADDNKSERNPFDAFDAPDLPASFTVVEPNDEGPWTRYAAVEKQGARKSRVTDDQKIPIRVRGPDGVITKFPYGTPHAKINEVMTSKYQDAAKAGARTDRADEVSNQKMLTYEISAPNGRTYEVQGPKGATDEQLRNEVLRQHPDAAQAPGPQYDVVAFDRDISKQLWSLLVAALIPPALLALAMFAVSWIRRGFVGQGSG